MVKPSKNNNQEVINIQCCRECEYFLYCEVNLLRDRNGQEHHCCPACHDYLNCLDRIKD